MAPNIHYLSVPMIKSVICLCITTLFGLHCLADVTGRVEPKIHPELKAHTEHFAKKVYKVTDRVYSAVGWNVANIVMIVGDDGLIMVDAGLSPETSREVLAEFRRITDKPIVAVIYSHFHHDHIDGIKGLVSAEQVEAGKTQIYAHRSLMQHLVDESSLLGPILGVRTGYTFGFFLEGEDIEGMNNGIGPLATGGRPGSFIAPTRLVDDVLKTTIAGVNLEIIHVPSEAPDELAVYLPDSGVLIDTEVIQGPTFPNVYTLRGTKFRQPMPWVRSIDQLRRLKAAYLVPTHGRPVAGEAKVDEVLRMTRDGIQYVHDQTIRYMNKGLTPDELAQQVKLPPHLFEYAPYLRQYYGTVKQAVRQVYAGYLGWYEGDPVALDPLPAREKAGRLIDLMGGGENVMEAARNAYREQDYQWAAELATYLVRIDADNMEARKIKAAAFRQLGYASMNINWRNWYLTSALELEGRLDTLETAKKMADIFTPPDILAEMPVDVSINAWTTRLKAEQTLSVNRSLGFEFPDLNETYGLTIRRGVCQFDVNPETGMDMVLTMTKPVFDEVQSGAATIEGAVVKGDIRLTGNMDDLKRFLGYFETPGADPISLTLH